MSTIEALLYIGGIILFALAFLNFLFSISEKEKDIYNICFSIFCIIYCIILSVFFNIPKAIDVYRNKTTLEITYKDSIPIDSVVVFK